VLARIGPISASKTVWKIEEELVANELKGSRNSGGIGCGELKWWGFTFRQ